MPSYAHEGLIRLFRNRPELAPELAVLSCIAHGNEVHAEVLGRAALLAALRLSDERQVLYPTWSSPRSRRRPGLHWRT